MSSLAAVLRSGWFAFELPGYRDHPGIATYSGFDYETLPRVPGDLDDHFDWLREEPLKEGSMGQESCSHSLAQQLDEITADLELESPPPFTAFFRDTELHERIRSCTACYLELPDHIVRTIGIEDGFLIHFLSDQQWCLHWYIYINKRAENFVVVSPEPYGFSDSDGAVEVQKEEVWLCANSFSEFIYRFWLENEIWFALCDDMRSLNLIEQAYVDHYRRLPHQAQPGIGPKMGT